jgi:hypothetical protein
VGVKSVERGRALGEYMTVPQHSAGDVHDERWEEFHTVSGILKNTATSDFLKSS